MKKGERQLLIVGDRVLIQVEDGEERSKVGLYLPATAVDNQAVQGGTVVATGPGQPLPSVEDHLDEPWRISGSKETRYVPMQARVGDYALFFRKAAVEITFENERYLVVPQAAILTLARDEQENAAHDV
jgi:chaperonin GroES